jgi:hypothetical protein
VIPLPITSSLSTSAQATAGPDGVATATVGPERDRAWLIDRITVSGTSSAASQLRLYRGDSDPRRLLDSTYSGNQATSELPTPIRLEPGEYLTFQWTGCTPGAVQTASLEGSQGRGA